WPVRRPTAAASHLPSGAKTRLKLLPATASMEKTASSLPVSTSQIRTVSPASIFGPPLDANRLPSGENATATASDLCPVRRRSSLPLLKSQRRTVPSKLAEASRLPSGEQATPRTEPLCPWRRRTSLPVDTSQTWTCSSWLPEKSHFLSGEKVRGKES